MTETNEMTVGLAYTTIMRLAEELKGKITQSVINDAPYETVISYDEYVTIEFDADTTTQANELKTTLGVEFTATPTQWLINDSFKLVNN